MIYLFFYLIAHKVGKAHENFTSESKLQNKPWIKQGDLTVLLNCVHESVIFQDSAAAFSCFIYLCVFFKINEAEA